MAEINVRKKKSNSNWPWILLILLAVGIVGWLLLDTGGDEADLAYIQESEEVATQEQPVGNQQDPTQAEQTSNQEISSFVSYVEENEANIGLQHDYSSKALTELAGALSSLTEEVNMQNDPDLQNLKEKANQLEQNTMSEEHANIMSDAFTSAANVIDKVQNQKYPDMEQEASKVMEAAKAVQPSELATNQKEEIKSFFNESADAVQALSR